MARYAPLAQAEGDSGRRVRLPASLRLRIAVVALVTIVVVALVGAGHEDGRRAVLDGVQRAKSQVQGWWEPQREYQRPSKAELRRIVGDTPRYLVKDGWATYGFNNQRYMLESTLNLARIAERIPVLPDSIWARSCAVSDQVCAEYALRTFEHRNEHEDVVGSRWNDEGPAYKLGIENFLDLAQLRRSYGPFLTISEFMDLYDIDPALYDESLRWNTTNYAPAGLTTAVMPEGSFQNRTFIRVDRPPPSTPRYALSTSESAEGLSTTLVNQTLEARPAWTLQAAREALDKQGAAPPADDAALVRRLEELGVVPLYTFSDEVLMNKALARPTVELAMPSRISPLTTTLSSHPYADASIVYLAGNLHDQRKAGGLRFTTFSARDDFVDMVLRGIRAPPRIREVGQRLAKRMAERVNGRRWVAAHLRRGDFVNIAWSPAKDALVHFDKTKKALDRGVRVLQEHFDSCLPLVDDPFYLATDETNTTALAYYRSHGAILLSDLLIPADTAALGWPSSYTDILAVVEQQVLAHADFFVGSELSSTSGGAINDRTALGKEEWSWSLLGRHD